MSVSAKLHPIVTATESLKITSVEGFFFGGKIKKNEILESEMEFDVFLTVFLFFFFFFLLFFFFFFFFFFFWGGGQIQVNSHPKHPHLRENVQ